MGAFGSSVRQNRAEERQDGRSYDQRRESLVSPGDRSVAESSSAAHRVDMSVLVDDPRSASPVRSPTLERPSSIGGDDSITSGYPKPHNRPLPSNNQLLFHLPAGFDVASIVRDSPGQGLSMSRRNSALVTIDKTRLPVEDLIHQLLEHFISYTAAAFPIFHIPTLRRWAHQVCFEDVAVDAEEACAVICEYYRDLRECSDLTRQWFWLLPRLRYLATTYLSRCGVGLRVSIV